MRPSPHAAARCGDGPRGPNERWPRTFLLSGRACLFSNTINILVYELVLSKIKWRPAGLITLFATWPFAAGPPKGGYQGFPQHRPQGDLRPARLTPNLRLHPH